MANTKELFERLVNDQEFATRFAEEVKAQRESGAASAYEAIAPVASTYGYEVTEEELSMIDSGTDEVISDEELGKVAGGTSCLTVLAFVSGMGVFCSASVGIYYGAEKLGEL